MALLGPSGSGKTTLLRTIAGLEFQDGGNVLFGDIDASQLSLRERRIGFVFQHYALFRHMTVGENVEFALRVRGVDWFSLFAYPMSGGFQSWSLVPAALVPSMLAFEEKVPQAVRKQIAFRMIIVLERLA